MQVTSAADIRAQFYALRLIVDHIDVSDVWVRWLSGTACTRIQPCCVDFAMHVNSWIDLVMHAGVLIWHASGSMHCWPLTYPRHCSQSATWLDCLNDTLMTS